MRRDSAHLPVARGRLFGSFARASARTDSDLDLLIDLDPSRDLLDVIAIKQDLEELLGRQVRVVTEAAINLRIRDAVLKDAVPLRAATRSASNSCHGAIDKIDCYVSVGEDAFFSESQTLAWRCR